MQIISHRIGKRFTLFSIIPMSICDYSIRITCIDYCKWKGLEMLLDDIYCIKAIEDHCYGFKIKRVFISIFTNCIQNIILIRTLTYK